MNLDQIPMELRANHNWVLWRYMTKDGRTTKIPMSVGGGMASSNDPKTWTGFEEAAAALAGGRYDGLGICLSGDLAALDIDHCVSGAPLTPELSPLAADVVETLGSYTEFSPSFAGIRILCRAPGFVYDKDRFYINNRKLGLEIYIAQNTFKYVTITGERFKDGPIEDRTEALARMMEKYMRKVPGSGGMQGTDRKTTIQVNGMKTSEYQDGANATPTSPQSPTSLPTYDEQQKVLLRIGEFGQPEKFRRLWRGDLTPYDGDHSAADMALCGMLAYWTDRDPVMMDCLFRRSRLMRPKWDERHGAGTYGQITIRKALESQGAAAMPAESHQIVSGGDPENPRFGDRNHPPMDPRGDRQSDDHARPRNHFSDRSARALDATAPSPWPDLIPFETPAPPEFPIRALPVTVADYVEALARYTQTPPEMAGALSIGVLAAVLQRGLCVRIGEDYSEPLCQYILVVAAPGERKSAVHSALTQPLREYEAQRKRNEAGEVVRSLSRREVLEKRLEQAKTELARIKPAAATLSRVRSGGAADEEEALEGEGFGDAQSPRADAARMAVDRLSDELAAFKTKHPYRLLIDDTTPEKLVDILDEQDGVIALSSAEGGLFDALGGRYDRAVNLDVYLKGHSGDELSVDRIGRKSNHIPKPRITLLLSAQPSVLEGLMRSQTLKGRGLCARFTYALCKSRVGYRYSNVEPMPPEVREDYKAQIQRLLSLNLTGDLTLSPEAQRIRLDYMDRVEARLREGCEWETMRDWGSKHPGMLLRIAGLLHAAEFEDEAIATPIDAHIMTRAVQIAECLGGHAMAAYEILGFNNEDMMAKWLLDRMLEIGKARMTKRELYMQVRRRQGIQTMEDIEPMIKNLVERGYVRETHREVTGRRSTMLHLNPLVLKAE